MKHLIVPKRIYLQASGICKHKSRDSCLISFHRDYEEREKKRNAEMVLNNNPLWNDIALLKIAIQPLRVVVEFRASMSINFASFIFCINLTTEKNSFWNVGLRQIKIDERTWKHGNVFPVELLITTKKTVNKTQKHFENVSTN